MHLWRILMDQALHDAHPAFRQRFHALAAQRRHIHEAWQEAAQAHDLEREGALIAREHDLLTEVHQEIAAYLALRAQRPP
jgi:hypothetical protein